MSFIEWLTALNSTVNGWVWGLWMAAVIVGVGLILSIRTGFVQFRKFGYVMKNTLGKIFQKRTAGKGEVTPFQALTTALAATVGTGNIAGVTGAVIAGGPGAVFWLWISGLIGMCTKFSEVVLAVKYRQRNASGDWVGGPMYYITNGLGKNWKWLAVLFSMFGALAALGIGCATQIQSIATAANSAIQAFIPGASEVSGTISLVLGILVAILAALVLWGGVKRIGKVTEKLVPFMAVVYIIGALAVIIANIGSLGDVFVRIFESAFSPNAAIGGAVGITFRTMVTKGIGRGVFSNEAGLGSAAIAHAATSEKNPVKQGIYGVCEVFLDTIVICTLTAVVILISGMDVAFGTTGGASDAIAAFSSVLGAKFGGIIIAVGLALFATSTIFAWSLYGTRCIEYLTGGRSKVILRIYQCIFIAMIVIGSTMSLSIVWDMSDTFNGLMAIPNLIALLLLSGVVAKETKKYFSGTIKKASKK
ncbi:MAG: alanine/glycine:cation symporter family protein [Oscillospiraceae bacterium]